MKFPTKKHLKLNEFVKDYAYQMQKAYDSIDLEELDQIASLLINSIKDNKKIYTCGNGGSIRLWNGRVFFCSNTYSGHV